MRGWATAEIETGGQYVPPRRSRGYGNEWLCADIEDLTCMNSDFRQVLHTGKSLQLKAGQDIGLETHTTRDQFFRIERGKGQVWIGGEKHKVMSGDAVVVSAGAAHNLTGKNRMRLYTIYRSPNHRDQLDQ